MALSRVVEGCLGMMRCYAPHAWCRSFLVEPGPLGPPCQGSARRTPSPSNRKESSYVAIQ